MLKNLRLALLSLLLVNTFVVFGFAQKSSPTGLTLEIKFLKERLPAYQAVAGSAAEKKWAWYSLFNRTPNFQAPAGSLPVKAVKIIPYLNVDTVEVQVSVFKGVDRFEREEMVGVYFIRENERLTLKDLKKFGVEPFEIAVVRVAPSASALPTIANKTNSLQVTSVEPNFSTLPTYKIRFLNSSDKAVIAFALETSVDGQKRLQGLPQGEEDKPLIEPGGTFEKEMSSVIEQKQFSDGQVPPAQPNQTFTITAVNFADGSYEGDPHAAAQFRAFSVGRKVQLRRIIPLLEKAARSDAQISVFKELHSQIAALSREIDENSSAELLKEFPMLSDKEKSDLRMMASVSAHGFAVDARKQLDIFTNNNPTPDADTIRKWLEEKINSYRNRLTRIP